MKIERQILTFELYKVHTSTGLALDCYDHIGCRTEIQNPDCHLFISFVQNLKQYKALIILYSTLYILP